MGINFDMTLNFKLGRQKKDGTCPLQIRFKDKGKDSIIAVSGVFIHPKMWQKHLNRVSPKHPMSQEINELLSKRQKKLLDVQAKYSMGSVDFNTAKQMLSNSSVLDEIHAFIDAFCVGVKSNSTLQNYRNAVNAFSLHTGIKNPCFKDITFENFQKLKQSLDEKGRSKQTLNTYLKNFKAICNYAKKRKITFQEFNFDSDWGHKRVLIQPKSMTTDQVILAIDNIKNNARQKKTINYLLRDFEAIGLWLLMFSMRGLYPKDVCLLSSYNLGYDFVSELNVRKKIGVKGQVTFNGNRLIYNHERSKSGNLMRTLLVPPIIGLINVLQKMISQSHPKQAFFKREDLKWNKLGLIHKKPLEEIDFLRLFNDNVKKDTKFFSIFNNYNKHLRNLGMLSFKSARKTFMTTSTHLDISQAIGRAMMGQKDSSISLHYNDFGGPKLMLAITEAHVKTLKEFEVIKIFNHWLKTHDEIFGSNAFDAYGIPIPQDKYYDRIISGLEEKLKQNKFTISNKRFL